MPIAYIPEKVQFCAMESYCKLHSCVLGDMRRTHGRPVTVLRPGQVSIVTCHAKTVVFNLGPRPPEGGEPILERMRVDIYVHSYIFFEFQIGSLGYSGFL